MIIVDEAHKRGRAAETHATTIEGLRLALEAGIDAIQHPELLTPRAIPDDLVQLIVQKNVTCSMLVSSMTGDAWTRHLKTKADAEKKLEEAAKKNPGRAKTFAEGRRQEADLDVPLELRRQNAQKLIRAGCRTTVGTDS